MIRSFRGVLPRIAASASISEQACVIGDVEIGEGCSVWPGAVIRADCGVIMPGLTMHIGRNTHIEDNCVLHGCECIGDNVVIGHGAVVEARKVGNNVLIGSGAKVLTFAEIGDFCIIAAGAVVREGLKIPDRSFVAGMPAEIKGEVSGRQAALIEETLEKLAVLVEAYKGDGF